MCSGLWEKCTTSNIGFKTNGRKSVIKLLSFCSCIRIHNHFPITDISSSFYGSCSEFREPVLDYND